MKTEVDIIRDDLKAAALREPEHVQKRAAVLNRQLRNYARSNAEERTALRPQINGSIKRLEASRAGR